jgi:hypothetical protein
LFVRIYTKLKVIESKPHTSHKTTVIPIKVKWNSCCTPKENHIYEMALVNTLSNTEISNLKTFFLHYVLYSSSRSYLKSKVGKHTEK